MASKRRITRARRKRTIDERQMRRCGDDERFKTGYESEERARDAASAYSQFERSQITHYQCEYCGLWHIGHTPGIWRKRK